MKNLKFAFLSMFMALFLVTACTNNEPALEEQQETEESQSISTTLNRLSNQFDGNGNVVETDNPAGNVVFDFCFDFVYPLTLSYNNGTTVTVNDLDDLIDIMLNSTDDLYISGVAFPFDVETFNDDTDSIEIETINNEQEFIALLLSCEFDDNDIDGCYEVYDPVCVEVTDPNGVTFIVTYPNECYAFEDGFTEDDFVDDCEEDYNCPGGTECFSINFPVTIITDNGDTLTVNSQEELDSALYDAYYFDFVYPFTVTLEEDDEVVTINSEEDIEDILEDCFDDYDDDDDDCMLDIEDLEEILVSCDVFEIEIYDLNGNIADINYVNFDENGSIIVNGTPTVVDQGSWSITDSNDELVLTINGLQTFTLLNGSWNLDCDDDDLEFYNDNYIIDLDCDGDNDDECEECEDEPMDPVCININGSTVVFDNACYAICAGYTEADFVFCNSGNDLCLPSAISDALSNNTGWSISSYNNSEEFEDYEITFNTDGTLQWMDDGVVFNGNWSASENPVNGNILTLGFSGPDLQQASGEWRIVDCDLPCSILLQSNNGDEMTLSRDCD